MNYKSYILSEMKSQKITESQLKLYKLSLSDIQEKDTLSDKEVQKFLKLIGVTEAMITQKLKHIDNLVNQFKKHLIYMDRDKAEFVYHEIVTYKEFLPHTDYYIFSELLKMRHYVSAQKIEELNKIQKKLTKLETKMTAFEKLFFTYLIGINSIYLGEYSKAEELLEEIATQTSAFIGFEAECFYHLSLVKAHLDKSSRAIFYGKKALDFASAQFNFKRSVVIQMSLAVNFSNANIFEDAAECYEHVLRNAQILGMTDLVPHVYHNMADLYFKMKNYSIALAYFTIAQQHFSQNDPNYINCLFNIALTEYKLGKVEDALLSFERLMDYAEKTKNDRFASFAEYFILNISGKELASIEYLEKDLYPKLDNDPNESVMKNMFAEILFHYHKEKGNYEKALSYIVEEKYTR